MAKGRMISSEIWEDDYFIDLTMLERMIWIGLLTCSADDQGRLQDNVRLIRSQLFPVDDIDKAEVEAALQKFADDKKIVRYEDEGKRIIQIRNWWRYQSPRWCGKSKYSPPEGWIDRERFHGAGGGIVEKNWKLQGGFSKDSIADSTGETTIPDVKDDVNGDGDVNDEVDVEAEPDSSDLLTAFCSITHLPQPAVKAVRDAWLEQLTDLKAKGVTENIIRRACKELTEKGTYRITSPKSIIKACDVVLAEKKRKSADGYVPMSGNPEYAGIVNR